MLTGGRRLLVDHHAAENGEFRIGSRMSDSRRRVATIEEASPRAPGRAGGAFEFGLIIRVQRPRASGPPSAFRAGDGFWTCIRKARRICSLDRLPTELRRYNAALNAVWRIDIGGMLRVGDPGAAVTRRRATNILCARQRHLQTSGGGQHGCGRRRLRRRPRPSNDVPSGFAKACAASSGSFQFPRRKSGFISRAARTTACPLLSNL